MTKFNIKLGSYLADKATYPPSKNPITFTRDTITWKNRNYAFDGFISGQETTVLRKQVIHSITELNLLGFNTSLMLYGLSDLPSQERIFTDLFQNIFETLPSDRTNGVLRLCADLSMECFEVFADDKLKDLFASTPIPENTNVRVRESEAGVFVDGLTSHHFQDANSCTDAIVEALKQQTMLITLPIPKMTIVPGSAEEKLYTPKMVAPAAHTILLIKFVQYLYVGVAKKVVRVNSVMQVVILASSDTFAIQGSPTDAIAFMSMQRFENTYNSANIKSTSTLKLRDLKVADFGTAPDVKRNLQVKAFKALSTLTRVVQLLAARDEAAAVPDPSKSNSGSAEQLKTKVPSKLKLKTLAEVDRSEVEHVPFRDSLLTRLLQSSLQGNFAQFMVTLINSEVNGTEESISALRFASSLYKLVNVITNSKTAVPYADISDIYKTKISRFTFNAEIVEGETLEAVLTSEAAAIVALDKWIFEKFEDKMTFPIQSVSDFDRAVTVLRDDLRNISNFCDEIHTYIEEQRPTPDPELFRKASVVDAIRKIRSEEGHSYETAFLPSLPTIVSPRDTGADADTFEQIHNESVVVAARRDYFNLRAPPQLQRASSLVMESPNRRSSLEIKIQQAGPGKMSPAEALNLTLRPHHRTSLPDLSMFLLDNGIADFSGDLAEKKLANKINSARRRLTARDKRKSKSSSIDMSSLQEEVERESKKVAPIVRRMKTEPEPETAEMILQRNETAFFRLVSCGIVEGLAELLGSGVSVHCRNSFGRCAMQVAARNGNLEMLKKLKELGGSPHTEGPDGETLIHVAGSYGHIHCLFWLLEYGVDPAARNSKGQSLAHMAARRCEVMVARFLHFVCRVSFDVKDTEGLTPMQSVPPRSSLEDYGEIKNFLSMITCAPETRGQFVYALDRELTAFRRYVVDNGILTLSAFKALTQSGAPIYIAAEFVVPERHFAAKEAIADPVQYYGS